MKLDPRDIGLIVTSLTAVGSLAVLAVKGRFDAKRDQRSQAVDEATTTVALLQTQIDEYRTERAERLAEHKSEKEEWREERRDMSEKFEKRISDMERRLSNSEAAYQALVLTVTTMGMCARASKCKDYDPGDRRHKDRIGTYAAEG